MCTTLSSHLSLGTKNLWCQFFIVLTLDNTLSISGIKKSNEEESTEAQCCGTCSLPASLSRCKHLYRYPPASVQPLGTVMASKYFTVCKG